MSFQSLSTPPFSSEKAQHKESTAVHSSTVVALGEDFFRLRTEKQSQNELEFVKLLQFLFCLAV